MTRPFEAAGLAFEDAAEAIARAGYRSIGLNLRAKARDGEPILPPGAPPERLAWLRGVLQQQGLGVGIVFARAFGGLGRDNVAARIADVVDCAALGCDRLLDAGPWAYRKGLEVRRPWREFAAAAEAFYAAAAEVADQTRDRSVITVIKPHTGVTAAAWELLQTLARIDRPNVRACYDAGNVAFYEGLRPEDDVADVAEVVSALCVKDHRGARGHTDFPTPGDGDVDHVAVLRTLRAAGFDGPAAVEMVAGKTPEEVEREAARCHAYLEAALEASAP